MDFNDFAENTEKSFCGGKSKIFFLLDGRLDVMSEWWSGINHSEGYGHSMDKGPEIPTETPEEDQRAG